MLCRAAIVPCQFFWDREKSQKISTCDFFFFFLSPTNTRVPPAVQPIALFFVYRRCNLQSFGASGNVRDRNCLHFNDGEVFLWLGKVLIGRVWKGAAAIEETTGKLIALHVPLLLFLCPSLSHSPFMYQIKKKSIFFQTWPEHLIPSSARVTVVLSDGRQSAAIFSLHYCSCVNGSLFQLNLRATLHRWCMI